MLRIAQKQHVFNALKTKGARSFATKKPTTPKEFLDFAKANNVEFVDFRFTDLHATEHHVQLPLAEVDEGTFKTGVPFDGKIKYYFFKTFFLKKKINLFR